MRRTATVSYFSGLKAQIEAAIIFDLGMGEKPVLIQDKHKSSEEGTLVHERLHPSRGHESLSPAGRLVAVAALLLVLPLVSPAQTPGRQSHEFLLKYAHFSPTEFLAAERGQTVAKILATKVETEVAAFGMVSVQVPVEYFVDRLRDIESFKRSPEVLEIGRFASSPCLEDLDRLTIDPVDLAALKRCRVGDCDVKLTSEMIENIRREAPKDSERISALYRRMLVDHVRSYLKGANHALAAYHDKKSAIRLAGEFRSLLEASPYLKEYLPDFLSYLEQPAEARSPDAEDFIYWSKEKFGLKPLVSITHVTIHRPAGGEPWPILIASKQIYASHYFTSSLWLAAFLESPGGSTGGRAYLMYLNRSRADLLGGGGGARRPETRHRQEESAGGPGEESRTDPGEVGKGLPAGGRVRHGELKGKTVVRGTESESAGARIRGGVADAALRAVSLDKP